MLRRILPILWVCLLTSCNPEPADLVIRSGQVITVDKSFSIQETVAIRDGLFCFVGSDEEASKYIGEQTEVIHLNGQSVLPGLIDAHAHLHSLGNELANLDISDCLSFAEVVACVQERVKTTDPGTWIIGGRWDHTRWPGQAFPVHNPLSEVSPDNPVYLTRVDGNSAFVNRKAMEIAGIDDQTPDPEGGKILRDSNGKASGVLVNRAMNLVKDHFPEDDPAEKERRLLMAAEHCNQLGLTGIHEAGVGPEEIALYKKLIDENQLNIRLYAMLGQQEKPILDLDLEPYFKENRIDNYGNHMLSVRSIKLFFDGALGSRGAAFFEDYSDDPGNKGLLRISPDYITRVCRAALKAGMGVNTHCIGIRGNRLCLDAYIEALKDYPDTDHRFRIEHAQIIRQEDVPLFTDYQIIPSMQPTHCTSDMRFIEDRIGKDRANLSYAWRTFLDEGLFIPCGSDFPVESANPLYGIYAAVTRQDHKGWPEDGWHPEQRMTLEEAIKGFTIWAARAAWQEDVLGSIEVGKLADLTIFNGDLLNNDLKEIINTQVLMTILEGSVIYSRQ